MTRLFGDLWECPNPACGVTHAKETLFSQWLRSHPGIESRDGFVVYDCDFIIHRYKTYTDKKTKLSRELQCIMIVEVKTYGAVASLSQKDTLWTISQFLRNRRKTKQKKTEIQADNPPAKIRSLVLNRDIEVRAYGVHTLTFEKTGPQNSKWIKWDGKKIITEKQLIKLLRFDLDPDTLRKIDFRRHHARSKTPDMFENLSNQ